MHTLIQAALIKLFGVVVYPTGTAKGTGFGARVLLGRVGHGYLSSERSECFDFIKAILRMSGLTKLFVRI
jgi:hypothetical protein